RGCLSVSLSFSKTSSHPLENFPVTAVFSTDDKPLISRSTIHQRDDRSCCIFHISKTIPTTHIPWKFPECSFEKSATGVIPVTISQQGRRIYNQGCKALTHTTPNFHFSIVLADTIV